MIKMSRTSSASRVWFCLLVLQITAHLNHATSNSGEVKSDLSNEPEVGNLHSNQEASGSEPGSVEGIKVHHVALVSGCDSHLSSLTPLAYSLLHHPLLKGKYRVTFVTGSQCRHVADKVGAGFYDTGVWPYPILEPPPTFSDLMRNISMGPLTYGYPAVDAFVGEDRPDLIVAELFNVRVSHIAELNDIPYATMWAGATPHPSMYQAGYPLNAGLAGFARLSPNTPRIVLDYFTSMYFSRAAFIWHFMHGEANSKFNEMVKQSGIKKEFQEIFHICNSYPSIALAGPPLFPLKEVPGRLSIAGMQPTELADRSKMDQGLVHFIEASERDILYVALGTYATFSEQQFRLMVGAFEKQKHFNVIWSHNGWNETLHRDTFDKSRLYVKKSQPQKEIFTYAKTKVFLSHCGANSMVEGVAALKVFIGCPQMADQKMTAQVIESYQFGTVISATPSETELISALEDIHTNMEKYQRNVLQVKELSSKDSAEKLERIVNEMIMRNMTVAFDVEESLYLPIAKAAVLILSLVLSIVFTALSIIGTVLYCLCCRKKRSSSQKKEKSQ